MSHDDITFSTFELFCRRTTVQNIHVEDDVYQFLVSQRHGFETESETLRRELGIPRNNTGRTLSSQPTAEKPEAPDASNTEHKAIRDFLQTSEFLVESSVAGRYLAILGWLYRRDPKKFEALLQLSGRLRRYFGRSAHDLEERGSGVKPQPIRHSPFWADTNNDTMRKRKMLATAMRVLRCGDGTIREALSALR